MFLTNPLSPNSDQHQISRCNINAYSTSEVMRINDMITQGEFLDILITYRQYFYKKSMGTRQESLFFDIRVLKGLRSRLYLTSL